MWYGSSVSKKIFLVLVLLVLLTGALTLRVAWERTPKAEAQGNIQQPGPIQEPGPIQQPGPIQEPGPIQRPGPQQQAGPLMNAGGPNDGPVPVMPNGGCPKEFPVRQGHVCYS